MVGKILLLFILHFDIHAQEICKDKFASYKEVLICAQNQSPHVQRAVADYEKAKAQILSTGQWQNPEVTADVFDGSRKSETDLHLGIPIELGGKISARVAWAEREAERAQTLLFAVKEKVANEIFLKMHRLRQLVHEEEVIEEARSTFAKLVSRYSKRMKLSPEQELSQAIFRMSKSEYDLKKATLSDEFLEIDSYLKIAIGRGVESIKGVLPSVPKDWPKLDSSPPQGESSQLKMANAELATAVAEREIADSQAWPTLTLGPSLKLQSEAGTSDQIAGFNLSMPLPIFSLNGGAKRVATQGVFAAKSNRNLLLDEQNKERTRLVRLYDDSLRVLSATLSHQDIEKKHIQAERLFGVGTVSSSLVIEAHRVFVELEKLRNERELKTLEALITVNTFDGRSTEGLP